MNNSIKLICFSIFSFLNLSINTACQADSIHVPLIVLISINGERASGQLYNSLIGPSRLSQNSNSFTWKGLKQQTDDYKVNGAIYTNCPNNVCDGSNGVTVQVSPNPVKLSNGYSEVSVDLRGRIGNKNIEKNNGKASANLKRSPIATNLGWQSDIEIIGDIYESTISLDDRPGDYLGTFTIEASKI